MKKKIFILLAIFINISYFCFAQTAESLKPEVVQQTYFTQQLALTPDEATKLWPIYNNYKNEVANAKKDNANDQVAMEEKVVAIRKKYKTEFKPVLGSDERVNKLFIVEKNFYEMLRLELIKRQQKQEE